MRSIAAMLAATEQMTAEKRGGDPTTVAARTTRLGRIGGGGPSVHLCTGAPVIPRTLLTLIRTLPTRLGVIPRTLPTTSNSLIQIAFY